MTMPLTDTLVVNEIFFSIQGESTLAGRPCIFIRLTGCDLRCAWCDTSYAYGEGSEVSAYSILDMLKDLRCNLVEVTGGEPLMQENVRPFLKKLCDEGYTVLLETGGHRDIGRIDSRVKRIMDIKCPGSNMEQHNRWENIELLTPNDEVKFVIASEDDYRWAKDVLKRYGLPARCTVLFSPVFGKMENRILAEWILRDRLRVLFQLQMQKYIWDPTARGV